MGGRKFHLTVTIEIEKRLQIRGLLDFIDQKYREANQQPLIQRG
jgi:hypothetical protein